MSYSQDEAQVKNVNMLLQADAYKIPLPDQSVHTVITSPPYWGLRKYSGEQARGMFPDLGLEKTPEEHIERMVFIFREIRRVLRDDGVVWLNYADCFDDGQLQLMPHRVAIALQDDWIVRNDLIWFKRNPMPESVAGWRWEKSRTKIKNQPNRYPEHKGGQAIGNVEGAIKAEYEYGDDYVLRKGSWRHTRAHEYIFQLVKNMGYYCNQEAVREGLSDWSIKLQDYKDKGQFNYSSPKHKDHPDSNWIGNVDMQLNKSGRNPRSVLDVPTAPYKGAHYATFPPNLIAPLIRASCPRRSCPECGQAWAPVVEQSYDGPTDRKPHMKYDGKDAGYQTNPSVGFANLSSKVLDYRPTCSHNHDPIPGIVLDPFIGSGTTGAVARELQRRWIGLDISMDYIDQQAKVRALKWTPSNALDNLPLFEGLK